MESGYESGNWNLESASTRDLAKNLWDTCRHFFRKRHPKKEFKELVWKTDKATYPTWKRDVKEISVVNEEAFK